eukprot:6195930-Pleurochrysis_carterae.AAC.1
MRTSRSKDANWQDAHLVAAPWLRKQSLELKVKVGVWFSRHHQGLRVTESWDGSRVESFTAYFVAVRQGRGSVTEGSRRPQDLRTIEETRISLM